MGFAAERLAIEKRLDDNWATTPIAFENVPYDPVTGTAYVALAIVDGPAEQVSLGDGVAALHRSVGTIEIDIYVPIDSGTNTGRTYADSIAAIFRTWSDTTSGVHCRSPNISKIGEDSGWYSFKVTVPFYMDNTFV